MSSRDWNICSECGKEMQRCRAASSDAEGKIIWVCRRCWNDLEYDRFLYEHYQKQQKEQIS